MIPFVIALALAPGGPATAPTPLTTETLRQFLVECDRDLNECRQYLNEFILGGIKTSTSPNFKCIPLERNKAADKMLGLMRDPELADWDLGNGLMQTMTDAFPCLTEYSTK